MMSQGSSESVQEFAARINKLGTQIFQSGNSAQNTAVRNTNDQLLQSRFISGLRNDIRRFVLARDPLNLDESISAALIEEQNMKLNQIANDERSGLFPSQTETSVISALTNKLEEINLRVGRLQEANSVTARKTDVRLQIISKSNSQYNTPALFVKQNEKWRLVLDFRKPNEITLTQDFVIPTLDDILHEISGSNYFSTLDMKSAFNQIPLHFADRHKTAFSTPDGDKYEFNRLCFGLKNSPKHFNQLHKRRYIKNFAKRALPLTNFLRKDTPFEWTSETQEAFDDIKKAILNPPVLALPDPNAELQITTDASSCGIGAVLEQKYPNFKVKTLYFFQRN
ncbi:retrovirus-related Pol polyprotein from transposon 412 [Trichonephila clavipes]|nr:retrovirus-related Pol polyprotein from transposon 412 [Trichonephila clavipes]